MLSNCTKNLLNLKDLIIKSVKNFENSVEIFHFLELCRKTVDFFVSFVIIYRRVV